MNVVCGAVERIDNPERDAVTGAIVQAFFTEETVIRESTFQTVHDGRL